MKINFVSSGEKKKIIKELNEKFGIDKLDYLLIKSGREKIRAFSGNITKKDILILNKIIRIELIGAYFFKKDNYSGLRPSFDAIHILKNLIKKNFIEINKEQFDKWIKGDNIEIKKENGLYIISYDKNFMGCGFSNGLSIINYIPKERLIKN